MSEHLLQNLTLKEEAHTLPPPEHLIEEVINTARYDSIEDLTLLIKDHPYSNHTPTQLFTTLHSTLSPALHYASANNSSSLKLILSYLTPNQVNMKNTQGNTALHWAVMNNHVSVVEQLIEAGGDVNCVNADGKDCIAICNFFGWVEMLVVILKVCKIEKSQESNDVEDNVDEIKDDRDDSRMEY